MARIVEDRQASRLQLALQRGGALLVTSALDLRRLEIADARQSASRNGGSHRRREDEARGKRTYGVADIAGRCDITTHDTKALGQGTVDDVDAMRYRVTLRDATATRSVHADGMDFVDVGHGVVFVGQVANPGDRRNRTVHGIDALEGDQLRLVIGNGCELSLEIIEIVVRENALLAAAIADAGDHRRVVLLVRKDHEPGQQFLNRRQRRVVSDERGREKKCRFLAVKVGELPLELDVKMRGAGDVARSTRTGSDCIERFVHRLEDDRILALAQIIVRAPHGDGANVARRKHLFGSRKGASGATDVGEHTVSAFGT